MSTPGTVNLFLGFDPAGIKKFGWSICREINGGLELVKPGLVGDAWDVINAVKDEPRSQYPKGNFRVLAAGIDVPLLWNRKGNNKGWRKVDSVLRRELARTDGPSDRVLTTNSLQGAIAIQGVLLVRHLSEAWELKITESHPKALEHLLTKTKQSPMVRSLTKGLSSAPGPDDERDATLSAVSAWAAIRKRSSPHWQNLYDLDNGLFNPSGIPVSYWMPIPGANQPH